MSEDERRDGLSRVSATTRSALHPVGLAWVLLSTLIAVMLFLVLNGSLDF